MKTNFLQVAALAGTTAIALAMPVFAADSAQDFVTKAAQGGQFEVDSSKVAEDKAKDPSVKDFAGMMIKDHGAANAKLATIAGEQKLAMPSGEDAKQKGDLDTLTNSKDSIDQPYVAMQRDAHSDAVALFEGYAKDGDNAALKAFAEATVPTLKMHKDKIEKIATDMSAQQPAAASTAAPSPTATTTTGAPVPGANSFTENQARDRIQRAGFSEVSPLTKDEAGIWRGQAKKDGKSMMVALDYQGNVVAGTN